MVGYSVALTPAEGKDVVPHAGGKLAKDLTLPLRGAHGWTTNRRRSTVARVSARPTPGVGADSNPWLAAPSSIRRCNSCATARHRPPTTAERGAHRRAERSRALRMGGADPRTPALRDLRASSR